jgi:GPH family glycoside/pentoside/hexuronide:cation symporter
MSSPTPESDRIPLLQKIMFGAGVNMDHVATGLMKNVLWMPFFNIGLGLSPALLGMVLMILQAWNAIMDPLMGNISDNFRSRWGRRRPFLVAGALLTALVYPWIWRAPLAWGETNAVLYLIGIGLLFYSCFSVWAMPYYGLQLELTPNYDERTRLSAWMTLFAKIAALANGWILAVLTCNWFINPATGKPDLVIGLRTCSWFIAGLILIFGLLPAIFVKERNYAETANRAREPLWKSIRESAGCKPLWNLIAISFFSVVGSSSVSGLGQYLNIYLVFDGDIAAASIVAGWKGTVIVVLGIASIPLWTKLGERFDKKSVVFAMLACTMLGHVLNYFFMRPDMPYLQIVSGAFESAAIAAVWLFLPSMKADVADYDELGTLRRREGSLNAFYSWFIKAAFASALGLSGLMLQISGFTAKLSHQPPEVLRNMMALYIILPLVLWGISLVFVARYPLSRVRMGEIREQLEARRGAA